MLFLPLCSEYVTNSTQVVHIAAEPHRHHQDWEIDVYTPGLASELELSPLKLGGLVHPQNKHATCCVDER